MDGSSISSNGGGVNPFQIITGNDNSTGSDKYGGYQCKTCGKKFHSFRALGGHQGIHKKVDDLKIIDGSFLSLNIMGPVKSSMGLHRCKLCKKVFESGPALGGHMTRHRNGKNLMESSTDDEHVMGAVEEGEEDEEQMRRRELMSAAKEWRLYCV